MFCYKIIYGHLPTFSFSRIKLTHLIIMHLYPGTYLNRRFFIPIRDTDRTINCYFLAIEIPEIDR